MKCKNCGTETTTAYCHNCGQKQPHTLAAEQRKKKSALPVALTIFIIFFISFFIKSMLRSGVENLENNEAEKRNRTAETIEAAQETEVDTTMFGWTDEDHKRFMDYTLQTSNNYITNYTSSPEVSDWIFADFSDNKVAVTTIFTLNNGTEKQTVFFIFSEENGTPTSHLLLINDTEYINDGSCDAILDAMNAIQQ